MKNLLNEIKAMNKIAGTELTKEQEIALIRERLQQLNELEFGTQKAFDAYQKKHDLRGDTKVTVAGKKMSVSQAVKQSKDSTIKGSSVFGNNKGGEVFGKKPIDSDEEDYDDDESDNEFEEDWDLKDVGKDISSSIDTKLAHGRELKSRLDKGEDGVYHQKSETGGTIEFKSDGKQYDIVDNGDGIKVDIVPNEYQKQYQQWVKNYQKQLRKRGEFPE